MDITIPGDDFFAAVSIRVELGSKGNVCRIANNSYGVIISEKQLFEVTKKMVFICSSIDTKFPDSL